MLLEIVDLGLVEYSSARRRQEEVLSAVINKRAPCSLILCRHYPVITIGRSGSAANLKASPEEISRKGVAFFYVRRGGDITYHGPGQLTVYPVIDLELLKKDVHWFLRKLEEVIIASLRDFGLKAARRDGLTGAWIGDRKIASIGIGIRHWVTYHGMSINVKGDDLENFGLIRPCGMDIKVTSIEERLGLKVEMEPFKRTLTDRFSDILGFAPLEIPRRGAPFLRGFDVLEREAVKGGVYG